MLRKIINLLKKVLPNPLVKYFSAIKRRLRLKRYFNINMGQSFIKEVNILESKFYININPYLNGAVDVVIFNTGEWESQISKVIKERLEAGDVFVDIGGNIGYYSLFAKTLQNKNGAVYIFEPIPRLCKQIKQSIIENDFSNITLIPYGLSDREGEANILIVDENVGASSVKRKGDDPAIIGSETIHLKVMDSFRDEITRVDLIKIDVEGNEYEALLGGEVMINTHKPDIIMEFTPMLYESDYEGKTLKFIEWLKSKDYQFFSLDNIPVDLQARIIGGNFDQVDILCLVSHK